MSEGWIVRDFQLLSTSGLSPLNLLPTTFDDPRRLIRTSITHRLSRRNAHLLGYRGQNPPLSRALESFYLHLWDYLEPTPAYLFVVFLTWVLARCVIFVPRAPGEEMVVNKYRAGVLLGCYAFMQACIMGQMLMVRFKWDWVFSRLEWEDL